ncbi:MAG: sigma-54-dependent transcriptional regulator [Spirochaetia bacterium]
MSGTPAAAELVCRVLIVDDEKAILDVLSMFLQRMGCAVDATTRGSTAITLAQKTSYDLIVLDLKMPEMDGLSVLQEIRKIDESASVIILTAYGAVKTAVEAMKLGAEEYMLKPLQLEAFGLIIKRILEYRRLKREYNALRESLALSGGGGAIIARSKKMLDIFQLVEKVAPLRSTVLLQGESGTGKELLARSIHEKSPRAGKRFVGINCGVIPVNLLESELFGYERGAFTGADSRKIGYFEAADGGTIFLDEISEMSGELQVKLLRVLQEHSFQRLGGTEDIANDVRVIASTNRELEQEVQEGRFRKDLYYRINVITVHVPPLRERTEDVSLLAYHFLRRYALEFQKDVKGISSEVMNAFLRYRWDGNIRELENVVERAVAVTEGTELLPKDLPANLRDLPASPGPLADSLVKPFAAAKDDFEREYLKALLAQAGGNISQAARISEIPRPNLYEKLKKHGLSRETPD